MQELLAAIPRASKTIKDRLRIIRNHNSLQYYIVSDKEKPNGTFLPQMQIKKAKTIAQRDYNAAAAAILKRDIATINNFLPAFHPEGLDSAFTRLHPGRRALVTPVRESDEDFIARWRHLPYTGKPFEINAPEHYAASGYILGKNLVATFEIGTTPLSTKQVQTCIKAFFG